MAQFDVFLLRESTYVVDVQSPLASVHGTRLVIPLIVPDHDARQTTRLNPELTFAGERRLLAIQFASTIDAGKLTTPVGSLAHEEWAIKGAIDFLISGF